MKLLEMYFNWRLIIFSIFCLVTLIQLIYYWRFFAKLAFYVAPERSKSQQHPVTVVVCARDEAENLTRNLPGLLAQTYPTSHEIMVVNHNSQDETRYLLEEFKKTFKGLHIVNISQEAKGIPGKKYPLSVGIKEAKHEIILLTDADCVPISEFWIEKMQAGFDDETSVVLGYGAYFKREGTLNKLIRFETFHTALQYLSYALAGIPYMGVGRNLSYRKNLFLVNKGFSAMNHVPGGDDDLFINKVGTKKNTKIVIDPESFTMSEPRKTFADWYAQKNRHYTTAKYYKPYHKFLLGLYTITHFLFYPFLVASIIFFDWRFSLGVFALRMITQGVVYKKAMAKLKEDDLFKWWWLLDIWMFIYYCIFSSSLTRKPAKTWN